MPSPKYPLWWIPVMTGVLAVLWLLGAPAGTCIALFAWGTMAYGIGWHIGVRAVRIRIVNPGDPAKPFPPDDCPYEHDAGRMLAIDFGLEVRCNGCGILVAKGKEL